MPLCGTLGSRSSAFELRAMWRPLRLMTAMGVVPLPALPSGVTLIGSVCGVLGAAPAVVPVSATVTATATAVSAASRLFLCMVVPPWLVVVIGWS